MRRIFRSTYLRCYSISLSIYFRYQQGCTGHVWSCRVSAIILEPGHFRDSRNVIEPCFHRFIFYQFNYRCDSHCNLYRFCLLLLCSDGRTLLEAGNRKCSSDFTLDWLHQQSLLVIVDLVKTPPPSLPYLQAIHPILMGHGVILSMVISESVSTVVSLFSKPC